MKIYIVTQGSYSCYHIEECFSSRELAEKYIEELRKEDDGWFEEPSIEEYELDTNFEICDVIRVVLTAKTPLSESNVEENIRVETEKEMRNKVYRFGCKVNWFGKNHDKIIITIIANENKNLEEEKKRAVKVAYDTLNRMKYLYEVLHITKESEMLEMLNKEI